MPTRPATVGAKGNAYEPRRGSARQRGYDTAWDKLSKAHREANPLCVMCEKDGLLVAAKVVDHIKPLRWFPALRLDPSNMQSLCVRHNKLKEIEDAKMYGTSAL